MKRTINIIAIFVLTILFTFIGDKVAIQYKYWYDANKIDTYAIKMNIISKKQYLVKNWGDIKAYNQIVETVKNDKHFVYPDYLFYSIVMANMYNYVPANFDVYKALTDLFKQNKKLGKMDKETKKLAVFYLERGAYKGSINAIKEMKRLKLRIPNEEPVFGYKEE